MAILKTSELREMGKDELQEKLNDLKKETIEERGQIETGGFADNPGRIKENEKNHRPNQNSSQRES